MPGSLTGVLNEPMSKLIYSAIASLNGYVADERGEFGWSMPDAEVHAFVNELERPIGTHLYGRRMYEVMKVWEGDEVLTSARRQGRPAPPRLRRDLASLESEFGSNDLCPCGSGRKFKKCFLKKEPRQTRQWADPLPPGLAA